MEVKKQGTSQQSPTTRHVTNHCTYVTIQCRPTVIIELTVTYFKLSSNLPLKDAAGKKRHHRKGESSRHCFNYKRLLLITKQDQPCSASLYEVFV